MKECLILGMALGFLVGAVLVEGNKSVEQVVRQGKETVANKVKQVASDTKKAISEL